MFHTSVYSTCMTISHWKELNEIINKKPAVWFDFQRIKHRQETKKVDSLLFKLHSYSTHMSSCQSPILTAKHHSHLKSTDTKCLKKPVKRLEEVELETKQ